MYTFDKYEGDMERFQKSRLHDIYPKFISHLQSMGALDQKSPELEDIFGISGAEVRQIVQYARRKSDPIISSGNGYRMALNKDDLQGTIEHLTERRNSLDFTITKLNEAFSQFTCEPPVDLKWLFDE